MKKCPYCAEKIQDDAILCRYCKNDLRKANTGYPSKNVGKHKIKNIPDTLEHNYRGRLQFPGKLTKRLFSSQGRFSRKQYWTTLLIVLLLFLIISWILMWIYGEYYHHYPIYEVLKGLCYLSVYIISIKRVHEITQGLFCKFDQAYPKNELT